MERPRRLVIWGAGYEYATVSHAIFDLVAKGQGEVLGIMADSLPPTGTLDGFPILPKEALRYLDLDYVLCCLAGDNERAEEALSQICSYGLTRNQIVRSKVMHLPRFDFERYLRLRESEVTIVADLCWSGMLYKRLDLRCTSPFFNMYIDDQSYLRLLGDLQGYCAHDLTFSRFATDGRGFTHPVMRLGDVELHFNHVQTPDAAQEQWGTHVDRINWGNLFVMMFTTDKDAEKRFSALEGYTKRIFFVPHETTEPYSMRLPHREGPFHVTVNGTALPGTHSYPFDPVGLLLGERDYVRYRPQGATYA